MPGDALDFPLVAVADAEAGILRSIEPDRGQHQRRSAAVSIIRARTGWQFLDCTELYRYRDLFRFLVWREIKARYAFIGGHRV